MANKIETSLVIRKENIYAKIRRNLYVLMYRKRLSNDTKIRGINET